MLANLGEAYAILGQVEKAIGYHERTVAVGQGIDPSLIERATAALEQLTRRGHRVVLFGNDDKVPKGVELHAPNVQAFADALGRCRAVVGSAGNHLPGECAMLGIPMLALHRGDDGEHEMNARLVEAAGIGIAASFEQCTPELVQRFESEFEKPRDDLAARTRAMPPASEVVPRAVAELCRERTKRPAWKTRAA